MVEEAKEAEREGRDGDGVRDMVGPEVGWWLFEDLQPGSGEATATEKNSF